MSNLIDLEYTYDERPIGDIVPTQAIAQLQAEIVKLKKQKRVRPKNKPATTEKGTFLLCVDKERLYARKRHPDAESAKTECKRLANSLNERVLILQVVAVLDRRRK